MAICSAVSIAVCRGSSTTAVPMRTALVRAAMAAAKVQHWGR